MTSGFGAMTNEAGPTNVAPTSRSADILTTQAVPPVQSSDQAEKPQPDAGVFVRVTTVPYGNACWQAPTFPAAQSIPAGDDVTVPPPTTETVSEGAKATGQS